MLLRQLRYFVTVVDCGSFTEAAEQCYISQSAISQQIRALEKDLGVELLRRENRHFSLTPAGEHFYRQGRELLAELETLRRETIEIGQDDERQLRIGYLSCYGGLELYQAVAEFSHIYPEVSIHIVTGTHEELYRLLIAGKVDLLLSDQRRAFSEHYVNEILAEADGYAELSEHHPLAAAERVTLEQLRRTPCILISSKEQRATEQEYYENILGFGGAFLFAENLEEARLMAVGNRGFIPLESVGTLPAPGSGICRIPLYRGNERLRRRYCAFWKKDRSNYYIEEFTDLLRGLVLHR